MLAALNPLFNSRRGRRATLYAGADYRANANATALALAMIETAGALDVG